MFNAVQLVVLRDAPAIPGLVFRPFRGAVDYPCMIAIREGSKEWDKLDPASPMDSIPTVDELAHGLEREADGPTVMIVEIGSVVIGYNQIAWTVDEEGNGAYFHRGWLLPKWRGKGIGRTMLHLAEVRLLQAATANSTSGTAVVLETNASSADRESLALLRNEGYQQDWQISDMALDIPAAFRETALHSDLTIWPIVPEQHYAIFRASADAWQGLRFASEDYQVYLNDTVHMPGFDPVLCPVAWFGDEVVGLVLCRLHKGEGFILDVAVRKAWRRRGIARALLSRCISRLCTRGISHARLYVDAENDEALRLYKSIGFKVVKEHMRYQKQFVLVP